MVNETYIPQRGDIVYLQFNPQAGREQKGRRPALVLTPESYNKKVGLAIFCPITSQEKGYPFEVVIPGSQKITGVILTDHVKNLDWRARQATFVERLPQTALEQVLARVQVLLVGT